jgi:muramoyltetrapeptide carboxypeptidase
LILSLIKSENSCCQHGHGSKHIYVYSPAGSIRDKIAFKRGIAYLRALGHEVEIDQDAQATYTRFAGDDQVRLASIHRAASSGADVALITRGAYGLTRLLANIDYKLVDKSIQRGTRFVGMSDFTAFQTAVLAKTGGVTWAGPSLIGDFGVEGSPDDIMEACFDDLLTGHGEGAGWRLPLQKSNPETALDGNDIYIKKAVLWGGNLAVLCGLVGTPYMPAIKGGVLFLEDIGEHPYRIERMLTTLLYSGVLEKQKVILLGQFNGYKLAPHDKGFKLQTVVDWLRSKIKAPILTNLPFGHVPTKVLLPVGSSVSLSVEGRDALLYWGHVH